MNKLIGKVISRADKELLQSTLETLFNKHQMLPRIREEMRNIPQFIAVMEKHGIDIDFGVDLLTQMAIHRRCKLTVLVGILRGHYKDTQLTADAIKKCCDADLVDFDPNFGLLVTVCQIGAELQTEIDKYSYPLPMVVPPKTVTTNNENGYHIFSQGSLILKDNHHNDDICLDHINRCNKIALTINHTVMTMVQNQWRNLDKPKKDETLDDYRKRVKAFEKYDHSSRDVMKLLLDGGNLIYLGHKYDKRGRTYCQGYHANYQGTAWNKSVIEFAHKELI